MEEAMAAPPPPAAFSPTRRLREDAGRHKEGFRYAGDNTCDVEDALPPPPEFPSDVLHPVVDDLATVIAANVEPYKHVETWQREPFERRPYRDLEEPETCDEHVMIPREVDAALTTSLEGIVDVHEGNGNPSAPFKEQVIQSLRKNGALKLNEDLQVVDCWGFDCYTRKNIDELLMRCLPEEAGVANGGDPLCQFVHRRLIPCMNSLGVQGWDVMLALRVLASRERERGNDALARGLELAAAVADAAEARLFPKHESKAKANLIEALRELAEQGHPRALAAYNAKFIPSLKNEEGVKVSAAARNPEQAAAIAKAEGLAAAERAADEVRLETARMDALQTPDADTDDKDVAQKKKGKSKGKSSNRRPQSKKAAAAKTDAEPERDATMKVEPAPPNGAAVADRKSVV